MIHICKTSVNLFLKSISIAKIVCPTTSACFIFVANCLNQAYSRGLYAEAGVSGVGGGVEYAYYAVDAVSAQQ